MVLNWRLLAKATSKYLVSYFNCTGLVLTIFIITISKSNNTTFSTPIPENQKLPYEDGHTEMTV